MRQELLYYRLALGQPGPGAFTAMLARAGAGLEDARSLV